MLQVNNLSCAKNEKTLFRNVSFRLLSGEVLQVTGKNGCGKTTLLRTIARILRPQAGKIICQETAACYIGHKGGLHPDLTVLQNLEFLQILDAAPENIPIPQALEFFGLQPKQHKKCGELSAGQLQRVSLTRLLLTNAKLWLLDEPLANLDQHAIELLLALCKQHLERAGMLVVATHNSMHFNNAHSLVLENFG